MGKLHYTNFHSNADWACCNRDVNKIGYMYIICSQRSNFYACNYFKAMFSQMYKFMSKNIFPLIGTMLVPFNSSFQRYNTRYNKVYLTKKSVIRFLTFNQKNSPKKIY